MVYYFPIFSINRPPSVDGDNRKKGKIKITRIGNSNAGNFKNKIAKIE